MNLFDSKHRTDNKPAKHQDNTCEFYDRSSWSHAELVRNKLNYWFSKYPENEKTELKTRFKKDYSSTFFELFVHELFRKQGFILQPHPDLPNSNKKPDFLVIKDKIEFYLEAKESTDKSDSERSIDNRINSLYDSLNETNTPNYYFQIEGLNLKTIRQPSGNKIKKYIESQLPNFDPDTTEKKIEQNGLERSDAITFENSDIRITITLIPKPRKLRGQKGIRPIGIYPSHSFMGGADESIKAAVQKKAIRYGKLEKPYLICINATTDKGLDKYDMMNALFGSMQVTVSTDPNNKNERWSRALDGIFLNSYGPRFTRVSGIFITYVNSAKLHIAEHWLIKHPFASKMLPTDNFELQKIEVISNKIETFKGKSIKEILEIPENWMTR